MPPPPPPPLLLLLLLLLHAATPGSLRFIASHFSSLSSAPLTTVPLGAAAAAAHMPSTTDCAGAFGIGSRGESRRIGLLLL